MSATAPGSTPRRWQRQGTCLAAALLLQGWPWLDRNKDPAPEYPPIFVTVDWVKRHHVSDRLQLVDARPAREHQTGHIPSSYSLDARRLPLEPAALAPLFARAGIGTARPVVVYSDHADPAAADQLFWRLEVAGHRNVRLLRGGIDAWRAARQPVDTAEHTVPLRAQFDVPPDTSRLVTYEQLRGRFGHPGTTIFDWRTPAAWEEGHIPHSLPLPTLDYLDQDGALLAGPDLRAKLNEVGPRPGEPADLRGDVVVCADDGTGEIRASPYVIARAAGVVRVRVFPGGYAEWRRHADAPVVSIITADILRHVLETSRRAGDPAILLDLRGDNDYLVGHIPGARLLRPDQLESRFDSLVAAAWPRATPQRTPLIMYCYGPTCTRTRNGTTFAGHRGWRNLYWFRDGMLGWQQAGGEVRRSDRP